MDGQTSGDDLGQCSFVSVVVLLVIDLPCLFGVVFHVISFS